MLTAFLSDVHANREALSACLEHARSRNAERFVFLGDHVGYGPDPGSVLDTISTMTGEGAIAILGNHDLAVAKKPTIAMQDDAKAAIEWTRGRLTVAQLEFLARLPLMARENGRLYVHANAWAPAQWDYITGVYDAARSMRATEHRWTFCGHVHTPALYHMTEDGRTSLFVPVPGVGIPLGARRRWLAIVGSAGQSRDGNPAASYALLDDTSSLLTFFRVPYDYSAVARKIRDSGLPPGLVARLRAGI
jgi:diadenosine tetraphosphatase ApaH/serine/threonine PP2A family protein phosphatase